jgi:hypothetical protein
MRPVRVRFFFGPGSGVLSNLRLRLYSLSDDEAIAQLISNCHFPIADL